MNSDKNRAKRKVKTAENKRERGDSLDQHQKIENANLYLDEGEISQQNNNL
ncbi:hypothetical protein [Fictibacillus phosphorivorans]|uniref:hypothetical protein n=1 Tax=Fictibacillus phosphorivorans TaxID=1221500 RepID=UPI00203EBE6B|nr:hypothetical protein [Fictibacillus phosphorivorans]MCM3719241.1 hypothetical protein [Fictibacillus phosphorivorans]MCM3776863.1 hypothetical protein [Fictibacillus phosphorivorans]